MSTPVWKLFLRNLEKQGFYVSTNFIYGQPKITQNEDGPPKTRILLDKIELAIHRDSSAYSIRLVVYPQKRLINDIQIDTKVPIDADEFEELHQQLRYAVKDVAGYTGYKVDGFKRIGLRLV